LHLKDITIIRDENGALKPVMTEIGNGNLCWDSIIKTAEKAGVKHYVVEQDAYFTESPLNSLKMSADFLKKYRA
jgi:sugar phosphate isomerase/epimerase